MLIALAVGAWIIWTAGVTLYCMASNGWTALRYCFGASLMASIGTPSMMAGFGADPTTYEVIATLIWLHLAGSIFSPYIFGLTVLPVLLFLQFKK